MSREKSKNAKLLIYKTNRKLCLRRAQNRLAGAGLDLFHSSMIPAQFCFVLSCFWQEPFTFATCKQNNCTEGSAQMSKPCPSH
jgi:hypothetical protein